ncbi:MAG: DUF2147 domain-containing protein [Bacteroidota bacterium]
MKSIKFIFTALVAVLFFTNNVKAQDNKAEKIVGNWYTENKEYTIQIYTINNYFYGRIIGFKDITDQSKMITKKDINNPNAGAHERPLIGKIVLNEAVFNGKDKWENGTYYDASTGKTTGCTLSIDPKNKIKIQWAGIDKPSYWTKAK